MRLKDHKRFIIGAQHLVKEAASMGVVDLTAGIYSVDFSVSDPDVRYAREEHYRKLLGEIGIRAVKSKELDFATKVKDFVASLNKGGVKRL